MAKPKASIMVELEMWLRAYAKRNNLSFSEALNEILYNKYLEEKKKNPNLPLIVFEVGKKGKHYFTNKEEYFAYRNKIKEDFEEAYDLKHLGYEKFICDSCHKEVFEIPHYVKIGNKVYKLCNDCFKKGFKEGKLERID